MMSGIGTLEVDSGELYNADSILSSEAESRYTPSLQSYNYENGRRYHTYRDGSYMIPNDEREQERLDLAHYLMKMLLRGRLHRAVFPEPPRHVLDFGTGTGSWAIDFADQNPESSVVGIDLSPIQPSNIPPNCRFYVDDVESPWTFNSKFDFVHGRAMGGSIKDWDSLLQQAFNNMNEGGIIEMQEFEGFYKSDDGSLDRITALPIWQRHLNDATQMYEPNVWGWIYYIWRTIRDGFANQRLRVGQTFSCAETMKEQLESQGFVDVRDDLYKLPVGPWPKDRRLKELGYITLFQAIEALEAFTLAPFTRVLGWSKEEIRELMERVKGELSSARNHLYVLIHFTYGRKPASQP